jgi:hypothetical protein
VASGVRPVNVELQSRLATIELLAIASGHEPSLIVRGSPRQINQTGYGTE